MANLGKLKEKLSAGLASAKKVVASGHRALEQVYNKNTEARKEYDMKHRYKIGGIL